LNREPLLFTTVVPQSNQGTTEIGLLSISGAIFLSFFGETKKEKEGSWK